MLSQRFLGARILLCSGRRALTVSAQLYEKKPTQTRRKPSKSKERILILSPEETKDKTLSRYVENMSRSVRRKNMPKQILQLVEGNVYDKPRENVAEAIEENIDQFKPTENVISSFKAHTLIDTLVTSFKKDQLLAYVRSHDMPMPRKTKLQIAEVIVRKIWKYKVPLKNKKYKKELRKHENQILKEEILPVSKFEIFLLLSQEGKLWKDVKSTLSSVKFTSDKQLLKLVGSESQIENAKVLISSCVDNCYREEVDLSSLRKLYEEKFGTFSVKAVGKFTEVYFTHLEDDRYEWASLNPNQIKRIRRLFLWHLGYNLHRKEQLHLPSPAVLAASSLLPYTNDYSVSWKERGLHYYKLKTEGSPTASEMLKEDLERFSDENLSHMEAKALNTGYDFGKVNGREMTKETYELLESIGLLEDDLEKDMETNTEVTSHNEEVSINPKFQTDSGSSTTSVSIPKEIQLSERQRDQIYEELTDFSYSKDLNGVADSHLEDPVFTVTLGDVLFAKVVKGSRLGIESPSVESVESCPHIFNTNVTLAFDHALASTINQHESGSFDEDPHVYSLQLKFVPSPFVENLHDKTLQRSLQDQIKYPPVEMWVQLNSQSIPDLETLQIVTVEAENNAFMCFPSAATDMRIGCQVTGRLLDDDSADTVESDTALDIKSLLNAPTSNYARFSRQSGVVEFLQMSALDFSGKNPTSIHPWIVLDVNGQKVRYDYLNTSYRRELTLRGENNVAVQLGVIDGGRLGGRRLEIRFIGASGLDRANFDKLLDYSEEFINKL
ncbi:CIC11C00000001175 [Sungouiella intermedia]|uniref:CIC11C00000001175 n=1 Tax=Sungouiella intermedia TaxID=45354 RepID=A0A1L0B754_9ASCO|nr:CIC11C00000001175 [[Candida] intermedia]